MFFSMNRRDVVATLFCSRALTLKWLTCIFNFGMKATFYFSEGLTSLRMLLSEK